MGSILHAAHATARPHAEAEALAFDQTEKVVATLAHMVRAEMRKGTTEPTEMADLIEVIGDRVDARFNRLDDTAENQALIEVLYDIGEALEQARLKLIRLDALCEGVTL